MTYFEIIFVSVSRMEFGKHKIGKQGDRDAMAKRNDSSMYESSVNGHREKLVVQILQILMVKS